MERPVERLVRAHVPQPHGSVLAAGHERFPVRAEGDARDLVPVAAQRLAELLVRAAIPQTHRAIVVGGRKHAPVRAEGDASDRDRVPEQGHLRAGAPGGRERRDHGRPRLRARVCAVRLEPEEERDFRMAGQLVVSGRRERERGRRRRRVPGLAPLHERPDPKGADDRDKGEQSAADAREPPQRQPARTLLLVAASPLENRLGEDVVEELVADRGLAGGRGDGAEDAAALAAAELLEHGRDLRLGPSRPLGEVGGGVGDLRLRAGDEVAEEVGGRGLLAGRELAERFEQVVLDDLLRAAERLQPGQVEGVRAGLDRRAPEPLQHELEEGRLDPAAPLPLRGRRRCRSR